MSDNTLAYEAAFWGDCTNTIGEELKQLTYAHWMGLERRYYGFDVHHRRILDVGGGPVSLLLKTVNLRAGRVIDPILYPPWTIARYAVKHISVEVSAAEDMNERGWDEVWIYNVLQHVVDPERVIANARKAAPLLRLFEWVNIPAYEGHPHMLSEAMLTEWVGPNGAARDFPEMGGRAFFGAFTT